MGSKRSWFPNLIPCDLEIDCESVNSRENRIFLCARSYRFLYLYVCLCACYAQSEHSDKRLNEFINRGGEWPQRQRTFAAFDMSDDCIY